MDKKKRLWASEKRQTVFLLSFIFIFLISNISIIHSTASSGIIYISTNEKNGFNCDGNDDQIEINKALSIAAEDPEITTVYLNGPNTYVISDSIFIGSDTILEGDSTAIVQLTDSASWALDKPLITQMDSIKSRNITIRGFEIDGNHGKNNEERGKGYYNLIYLLNTTGVKVYNMYMHNGHGDGLKIVRSSNIEFYNNTVYKLGRDALYAIYSSDLKAWNNKITCRTNSGLRIYNTNHVKFYNNIIDSEGEGGAGIEIQKTDSSIVMDNIEICNNLLHETNAAGIWITGYGSSYPKDSAKNIHIHHNRFYETGINAGADWAGGLVLNGFQNTLVENNTFDGCYGAAVAHKQVTDEFLSPGSGYQTIVRNNIIINTHFSPTAGKGYAVYNKLKDTHSFVLEHNCLSNNAGGNYIYANSKSDVEIDPDTISEVEQNKSLKESFPWIEAMTAGPEGSYEIEHGIKDPKQRISISGLKYSFLRFLNSLKESFSGFFKLFDSEKNLKIIMSLVEESRGKAEIIYRIYFK
jgi:hypothetical protein